MVLVDLIGNLSFQFVDVCMCAYRDDDDVMMTMMMMMMIIAIMKGKYAGGHLINTCIQSSLSKLIQSP